MNWNQAQPRLDYGTISEYLLYEQNYEKRSQWKPETGNRKYEFPKQGTDVKILFEDSLQKNLKRRVKMDEED